MINLTWNQSLKKKLALVFRLTQHARFKIALPKLTEKDW